MKPIAIIIVAAGLSLASVAASAKNETAPGTTNERMVSGVAGPKAAAETSQRAAAAKGEQPSKSELRKAKVKPKPPLQDPN
jgi:hypothetical protein